MNDKTKIIGALVIGAIAGAAIVKLLETDEGKELVDKAKDKAKSAADEIKTKISQLEGQLAELLKIEEDPNPTNQA
ncbi:MAG: YtxH domain-containing protein [Bacteroidetes bacterium]|nr:YtxH domain-containing protein [Bacteroidota bacterium]